MWTKLSDTMHRHRKTKAVLKTHDAGKTRDVGPMGLWVLAAAWCADHNTLGWIPSDELERWDDDWEQHTQRLVAADYFHPEQRGGEDGYGLVNYEEYNPVGAAKEAGLYGNHVRWHEQRKIIKEDCDFCPKEPDDAEYPPEPEPVIAPESGAIRPDESSGGDRDPIATRIATESRPLALPVPGPGHEPETPKTSSSLRDRRPMTGVTDDHGDRDDLPADDSVTPKRKQRRPDVEPPRFAEFWEIYDRKPDSRKPALDKYRAALKKRGVTEDIIIEGARRFIAFRKATGAASQFTPMAKTWLGQEGWVDADNLPEVEVERPSWRAEAPRRPNPPVELIDDPAGYARWVADYDAGKPVQTADGETVTRGAA